MSSSDDSTGIQLTYGINHIHGLNIDSLLDIDKKDPRTSPSHYDKPIFNTPIIQGVTQRRFNPISGSFKTLVESQLKDLDNVLFESAIEHLTPDISLAGEVLDADIVSPRKRSSCLPNNCYDPTVQDLIVGCELLVHRDKIIATASGIAGDIVTFSLIRGSKKNQDQHESVASFKTSISLQLKLPIKQIKMRCSSKCTIMVGIRTEYTIYLLNIFVARHKILGLKKVGFLESRNLAGEKLSDLDICTKAELPLVAIVDVVGNFALYRLINSTKLTFYRCEPYPLKCSTFHEPTDLSHFKRIVLNPCRRVFYLVCRSSLHQYNIAKDSLTCKVIAGAWSLIWDFRTLNDNGPLFMLLTSKELIVVDTSKGFKRLLAWKHYLNESDSSWNLHITTLDDCDHENYLCIIQSQIRNFCYVLQLEITRNDGDIIPKVVGQPTYFIPHVSRPINSLTMLHGTANDMFVCYNITADLEISMCLFEYSASRKRDLFPTDAERKTIPRIENLDPRLDVKVPDDCSSLYQKLTKKREDYDEYDLKFRSDKILSQEFVGTPTPLPLNEALKIPEGVTGDVRALLDAFQTRISECMHSIQGDAKMMSSPNAWITPKCWKIEPVTENTIRALAVDLQKFFAAFHRENSNVLGFLPALISSLVHISCTDDLQIKDQHDEEIEKNDSELPKDIRNLVQSFDYDMSLPTKYEEGSENVDISGINVASSQGRSRIRPKSRRKRTLVSARARSTSKILPKVQLPQNSLSQKSTLSYSQQSMEPDINVSSSQRSASQASSILASSQVSSFGSQPFSLSQGKKKTKKKHKKRKVGFW